MKRDLLVLALWLATSGHIITRTASNLCRDSCNIDFVTLGCFIDQPTRVLPYYIYNERDRSHSNYGGRSIDWFNWNEYFPGLACRCAQKAKEHGYDLFGLQFFGECWAGNSGTHNYQIYGEDYAGCVQDNYHQCLSSTRYCVGKRWRNMVYQIVDTSCPSISFEKVGCFNDHHNILTRPLPEYVFNDRDDSIDNFSGEMIDWRNWDIYVPTFACRCAAAAKSQNYTFFGMQFYGECWSGAEGALTYYRNGLSGMRCIDQCSEPCNKYSKYCSGKNFANFVYRISDQTCEVDITPVGCYKEVTSNLAMKDIFYNEADPQKPNYAGNMLPWSDQYEVDFPIFLCKCARIAIQRGWEYFGVRELGLCVRSKNKITNYQKHGASEQCFEENNSTSCGFGSKLCRGLTEEANFVYKISLPIHGGYSDWGNWNDCSATCGGGSRSRSRECNNPTPHNGGLDCARLGANTETGTCNENACPEEELGSGEYLDIQRSLKNILRPRKQPH